MIGALALLGWLALCHVQILRLRQQSAPVPEEGAAAALRGLCDSIGVRRPLLLASPSVRSPFLMELLGRPAIFVPAADRSTFDGPELRAILAHELAHLARRDCVWNLAARITCAIGWVQPLLWVRVYGWHTLMPGRWKGGHVWLTAVGQTPCAEPA